MTATLEQRILQVKALLHSGDTDGAAYQADELISSHPEEITVWLLRAYLLERSAKYAAAIGDLTCAIELNSREPHIFYTRGRMRFQLGDNAGAAHDFGVGLELCDQLHNDYYRAELHFWRAEALIRLGRLQNALQDLAHVGDDYRSWTYELRTKHDLLRDCLP